MTMLLCDGNNLAARSYHAAKAHMSHQGVNTGGLQLFVTALAKHVAEQRPDSLLVLWDTDGSRWRTAMFPPYKAARRMASTVDVEHDELFALVKRFCSLAGVSQFHQSGWEADDLIAAAWHANRHTSKIVLLSDDKDLLQLLDDTTVQIKFSTPDQRWTRERFIAERGYTPEQLPLMMALMGDPGDGVPGMHNVGKVKALARLRAADWDLDRAMAPYPDYYGIVRTSLALVDLRGRPLVQAPTVPAWAPTGPQDSLWDALLALLDDNAMGVLRSRLERGTLWTGAIPPGMSGLAAGMVAV